MRFNVRKFWISENWPVDHIGALQTPTRVKLIVCSLKLAISGFCDPQDDMALLFMYHCGSRDIIDNMIK